MAGSIMFERGMNKTASNQKIAAVVLSEINEPVSIRVD
jgi:hypothetical protein